MLQGSGALVDEGERLRQLQGELESARREWATTFDSISDAVWVLDLDGRIVHCNKATSELLGKDPAQVVGRRCWEVAHGTEQRFYACPVTRMAETLRRESMEIEIGKRWFQITVDPIFNESGNLAGIVHIMRDITLRKRAEFERELNEERLNALFEISQMTDAPLQEMARFAMEEAVRLTKSKIGYVAFASEDEQTLVMHSWSREAMRECRTSFKPLVFQLDQTGLWGEAVRQRRPIVTNDYSAPNPWKRGYPRGHVRLKNHMNVPVFDGDRVVVVAGVSNKPTDYDESDVRQLTLLMTGMWRIVKQHSVEQDLREREETFRTLFEASSDAIFIVDQQRILDCNQQALAMFQYSGKDQLMERKPFECSPPQQPDGRGSKEKAEEKMAAALAGESQAFDWVFRRPDGTTFDADMSLHAMELHGRKVVQGIIRDVTERNRSESEKREFYRQTILSVTDGKLVICDEKDVEPYLQSAEISIGLESQVDMARARRMVAEVCEEHGLVGQRQQEFIAAAGEAVTNAIKHGGGGRVWAGTNDSEVWAGICDCGHGIDSLILPNAVLRRGFSTKPSLGLGYTIMLEVADRLLLQTGPSGTTVILFKKVQEPHPVSLGDVVDMWDGAPMFDQGDSA